jgi:hypothetical protein
MVLAGCPMTTPQLWLAWTYFLEGPVCSRGAFQGVGSADALVTLALKWPSFTPLTEGEIRPHPLISLTPQIRHPGKRVAFIRDPLEPCFFPQLTASTVAAPIKLGLSRAIARSFARLREGSAIAVSTQSPNSGPSSRVRPNRSYPDDEKSFFRFSAICTRLTRDICFSH